VSDFTKPIGDDRLYSQSTIAVDLPNVRLQRDDGLWISFVDELTLNKYVIVSFSFLSCKTVCPMILHNIDIVTKNFSLKEGIQSLTVTLDPKNDSPEKLSSTLKSMSAQRGWRMYTGSNDDIVNLQKAFQVYRGDKMNHLNAYLIHRPNEDNWMLLNGSYITPNDLMGVITKH
jgi:protein SCO1/2